MNAEKRKRKRIKNSICMAYCAIELLVALLAFRGLGMILEHVKDSGEEIAMIGTIVTGEDETAEESGRLVICVDAGHGGNDPGSEYRKRAEKDDTLKIAQAVSAYLKEKDVEVVMTRENDTYLALEERCNFANEKSADYFVSLHRNDGLGRGVETWVYSNATEETKTLADNIMQGLDEAGIQKNRGVKKGTQKSEDKNYYINAHSTMPACIVELGFISNTEDNRLFDEKLDTYAAAIGEAILKTYESYGGQIENSAGDINGTASDSGGGSTQGQTPESGASGIAVVYPQIGNVETLDNTSRDWGQGVNVDDKNRPLGAIDAQQKYGDSNAVFIGEETNTIYLTIDEGYEYGYTESMLNTLKEKGVNAVFFITEPYAKDQPELVKRMIAEGHAVGNHSVTHPAAGLPSLSMEQQQEEVLGNHAYVKENFGYEMHLFRYPAGKFSEQSLAIVNNCGYKSVFWSFAYVDYDVNNQPEQVASLQKMTDKLHPGAVYLLHGESETNAAVLGAFIDKVRAAGYEFALLT